MHLGICQAALPEHSSTFVCKPRNSSNKSWHCPTLGRLQHASASLMESGAANASSSPVMGSTRVRSINGPAGEGSRRTEGAQVMGGRPRCLKLPPCTLWLVLTLPGLGSALPSGLLIAVKRYVVSSSQPKMTHPELTTSPCCPVESSETPREQKFTTMPCN